MKLWRKVRHATRTHVIELSEPRGALVVDKLGAHRDCRSTLACVGDSQAIPTFMGYGSWRHVSMGKVGRSSKFGLEQFGACFGSRLGQVVVWLRTAFDGARFDPVGTSSHELL